MNGFNEILANHTVDEETCVEWTEMLLTLSTYKDYKHHTERIRRMMSELDLQGYFKAD